MSAVNRQVPLILGLEPAEAAGDFASLRSAADTLAPESWTLAWDSVKNEQGQVVCFGAASERGRDRLDFIAAANPSVIRRLLDELDRTRRAWREAESRCGEPATSRRVRTARRIAASDRRGASS